MANSQTSHSSHASSSASAASKWSIAATLAFVGAINPSPIPLSGLHKFYVGQPIWGGIYLLLSWTQIPRVACAVEGIWYVLRYGRSELAGLAPPATDTQVGINASQQTQAIATALRELENLRQEGLISEHEFEQNRRSLVDKMG